MLFEQSYAWIPPGWFSSLHHIMAGDEDVALFCTNNKLDEWDIARLIFDATGVQLPAERIDPDNPQFDGDMLSTLSDDQVHAVALYNPKKEGATRETTSQDVAL